MRKAHSVRRLKEAVWHLPGPVRRAVFPLAYPKIHSRLKTMRGGFLRDHSLLPFIEHEAVYIHIPKVAGVSISDALFGNQSAGHLPMRVIEHALGAHRVAGWFRFAFVRNPWDRLYSAYRFLIGGGMNADDASLGREIESACGDFNGFVLNWLTPQRVFNLTHLREQTWFLRPIHGPIALDFLGRFERLAADYEDLRERLGFGEPLGRLNVTAEARQPLSTVYSDEAVERVRVLYAEDIREFGYRFEAGDRGSA